MPVLQRCRTAGGSHRSPRLATSNTHTHSCACANHTRDHVVAPATCAAAANGQSFTPHARARANVHECAQQQASNINSKHERGSLLQGPGKCKPARHTSSSAPPTQSAACLGAMAVRGRTSDTHTQTHAFTRAHARSHTHSCMQHTCRRHRAAPAARAATDPDNKAKDETRPSCGNAQASPLNALTPREGSQMAGWLVGWLAGWLAVGLGLGPTR
jgi:hypothetical protein